MIDSVTLLIPWNQVVQDESSKANWVLQSKSTHNSQYMKNPNPTKEYMPRLTSYGKWFKQDASLRIEFSVPKLIYQNNLDEVEDKDFNLVITTLQKRLASVGVVIHEEVLISATVSSIHFSRNIQLEGGYTTNYLIGEMNKVNLRKSFDFTRSRYTNDGQSLYAHTDSHELIIYDKVADIRASEKKSIDRDPTLYQKNMLVAREDNNLPEVIRFEVRLVKKRKMNEVIVSVGYKPNPTFQEVFNSELSKRVVTQYWEKIIKDKSMGVFSVSMSSRDILQTLYLSNKNIKPKQALYLGGLMLLAKDGIPQLRTIITKKSDSRSWYRIAKDIKSASYLLGSSEPRDWVSQIDRKLHDYKPFVYRKM